MTTLVQSLRALEWRRGFDAWARSDGVAWVYIFKVLMAAFLTYWVAMRLELPQPRTAMITVFIVMQPQSGHVFAKSFFRILGTLAGSAMMVLLIALFPQDSELFLGSLTLWIGLCCAGAARYRNFHAYGFVLAGYTAVMIGIPVLGHPDAAFMAAVWRLIEISLGIACSTLVTAALLPQSSGAAMRNALYQRFGGFARLLIDGLHGNSEPSAFEHANVKFIADAVGLESLRSVTVFEDPHMRRRNGRLNRLNSEFMAVTTRFNALHHALERLRARPGERLTPAIEPALRALTELLEPFADRALTDDDAARLADRLTRYQADLPEHVRELRGAYLAGRPDDEQVMDFHTVCELLYRLVDDLHNYAQTHASLAEHSHVRERWDEPFTLRTHWMASAAAGLRAMIVVGACSAYWLVTAWPSGGMATLVAAMTVALSSTAANPRRMSVQLAAGTLLGAVCGFIEMFVVFPRIDGYPLLCLGLAPVLAFGAYLTTRPRWVGCGLGLLMFFSIGSAPDNLTQYNPYGFINDYIGMVIAMVLCACAGSIVLPPNSRWFWRHLQDDLRREVVFTISGPMRGLRSSFESQTRDLMHQAYGLTVGQPHVQRELLRWMFVVLEVGNAIIDLRREQDLLPVHPAYAEWQPWRQSIRVLGRSLIRLFIQPDRANLERSLYAVESALITVRNSDEPFGPHFDTSVLRRVQSYLHFIRSSLIDPQSPLAIHLPRPIVEVFHAA